MLPGKISDRHQHGHESPSGRSERILHTRRLLGEFELRDKPVFLP
jgi:hypothetical protein